MTPRSSVFDLAQPATPSSEFLVTYEEWLRAQNGEPPRRGVSFEAEPRYIATKRDLAEKAKALGANKADVPVVISADRKATYESVVEVLDVLRGAEIRAALMVKPGS